jgi:DNA-binding SARP family transcriptional activator
MARLTLSLLGGFQAWFDPGPPLLLPPKAQALLAYLAMRPGQTHPRDKLAAILWGGTDDEHARSNLRHTLFDIRQAVRGMSPDPFVTEGKTVALRPDALDVDVLSLERLVAEGTPAALEQAAALYHGDLLEGLSVDEPPYEEWLVSERERVRELALEALARLFAQQSKSEPTERAIRTAIRLLSLDPLQEAVHRALMRLYARQGRRGAALRQYQACVAALQRELGAEPETETRRLYEEILRRGSAPRGAETVLPAATPPDVREASVASLAETPMVGRDVEKGRLFCLLDEAEAGRGRLAVVRGEAGIGKTRLAADLAARAASRGTQVLLGRSYQSEQILAFGPWVDAFRTGRIANAAVLAGLEHTWRDELALLMPELGSVPANGPRDQRRLFEAVMHLLAHLAASGTLVLILEDVHLADDMSVRLLAYVGRRIQSWPMLVLATVREEELIDAPKLRRVLEDLECEEVALGPLSESETVVLVTALSRPGVGTDALRQLGGKLWETSEGNPLMIVETMRALGQSATPDTAPTLPGRVRDVILRRLDRLSDRSRELVALASVIGRKFDFDLLLQAAGFGDRETARAVEELVRRRVVHVVGEHLDFTHDLIRTVAYDQLPAPQRKLLHRVVAMALERACGEDTSAHDLQIGGHYREAEMWDKAVTHLSRAGEQAYLRWALVESRACREQALAALEKLPLNEQNMIRGIDIRLGIRQCYVYLGDWERALPYLRDAEVLAARLGDVRRQALVATGLCSIHKELRNYAEAIREGHRALALNAEDLYVQAASHMQLGQAHRKLGNYQLARDHLIQSVTAVEEDRTAGRERAQRAAISPFAQLILLVNTRHWLVLCLAESGDFGGSETQVTAAITDVDGTEQPYPTMRAHTAAGDLYLALGNGDRAVHHLEIALAELPQATNHGYVATAARLAYAYALAGRLREAQERLDSFLDEYPLPWSPASRAQSGALACAHTALLLGRTALTRTLVTSALQSARTCGEHSVEANARQLDGMLAASLTPPDVEAAESGYGEALTLARALGMRPLVAHCHLGLGKLYRRTGKREPAQKHLATATMMYREMGMTYWLEQAETETRALA